MNIRCAFCQTPYTLSRNEILFALQKIESEKLNHYDAHCPRCRRATQLPRQRIEMAFPNWRQALQEAASAPVAEAPSVPAQPQSVSMETAVTEPIKREEPAPAKIQPVKPVKKTAGKEKAVPQKTKPAVLKKTAAKKTAAKAKPVTKKPAKSKRK